MSSTLPYTGGDATELLPRGGRQIGTIEVGTAGAKANLTKQFEMPWSSLQAFLLAMLNRAIYSSERSNCLARRASLSGRGAGPVKAAGDGEYGTIVVELGYETTETTSDSSSTPGVTVTLKRDSSLAVDVIALGNSRIYRKIPGQTTGEAVKDGYNVLPVPVLRKTLELTITGGNWAFYDSIVALGGKIDMANATIKCADVRTGQSGEVGGVQTVTITVVLDYRDFDWNMIYYPETNSWGYLHTDPARTTPFLPYRTAPVIATLRDLGITP